MLRLVEIRYDAHGRPFVALQGQTDEEAREMNLKYCEARDRMAARIFSKAMQ